MYQCIAGRQIDSSISDREEKKRLTKAIPSFVIGSCAQKGLQGTGEVDGGARARAYRPFLRYYDSPAPASEYYTYCYSTLDSGV